MKTSNPFQIPACLQRADLQQRRRERFRNGFMAALAAHVVLFAVLLIQGCKTGKTAFNAPGEEPIAAAVAPAISAPAKVSAPAPVAALPAVSAQPMNTGGAPISEAAVETVYVVKSGDNLTRIAKIHNSTVKAIKSANNLNDDRLLVGVKLRIPQA